MSNVQWIFPVAHTATLLLVASNIKCFGHKQEHQKKKKMIVAVVPDDTGGELDPSSDTDNEDSKDVHHTVNSFQGFGFSLLLGALEIPGTCTYTTV